MSSGKILTIEIGEKYIRVCEIGYGRPIVYRAVSFPTPEGSIYDGYIVSVDKLAEYLDIKLKEARIFRRDVIFSIASGRIMSREMEIPYVKNDLLRKTALARAKEYFPKNLEDYVISTLLLTKSKKVNKMRINLFAAPRDLIVGYFNLANKLAMRVESIDYIGNSLHQWLNRNLKNETAMVVNIGYYMSLASIMDEGKMRMQHNISAGLAKLIDEPREENKVTFLAAKPWELIEEIKEGEEPHNEIEGNAEISEDELAILTESIFQMLDYYNLKNLGKPITKVYIIGEGVYVPDLLERIENTTQVPIVIMKTAFGTMVGSREKNIEKSDIESFYISCMGAGINPADLVPYEVRIARERKTKFEIFRNYSVKFTIFLLLVLALCRMNFAEAEKLNMRLKDEIKEKSYAVGMYEKYTKDKREYEYLAALDAETEMYKDNLLEFLMEIEKKLPKGTKIMSFESNERGAFLAVNTLDKKTAAKLIMQIREAEYIEDVYVSEIKYNRKSKNYTMKMICSYKGHRETLEYE